MSEYAGPHQATLNVGVSKVLSDIGGLLKEGAAALKNAEDKKAVAEALKKAQALKPWNAASKVVGDFADFMLDLASSNPTLKAGIDKARQLKAAFFGLVSSETTAVASVETDVCSALAERLDKLKQTQATMAAWLMALNLLMNVITAILSVMDLRQTCTQSAQHTTQREDLRKRLKAESQRLNDIDDRCLSVVQGLKFPNSTDAQYDHMELLLSRVENDVVKA